MKSFKTFLKEDIEKQVTEDTTFLILTKVFKKEEKSSVSNFINELNNRKIKNYVVETSKCWVSIDEKNHTLNIKKYDGENDLSTEVKNTVAIIRGSVITHEEGISILTVLEDHGVFCANSKNSMLLCENKFQTAVKLQSSNIPIPKTALVTNSDNIENALKEVGGKFPVIVKTLTGAEGIGVSIIDSYPSLKSVLQSLWKFNAKVLIQEKLDFDFDVRTIIVGDEIVGSMKRIKKDSSKDFRSNYALGNDVDKYELSESEKEILLKSHKVSGCYYSGLDHVVIDSKPLIIEINGSPGTEGISKVLQKNVTSDIIDYILKHKSTWTKQTLEIGIHENIEIEGIGKVKAKIDSGNNSFNVLSARDIKINGGNVSFKTANDKQLTLPIIKQKKIIKGTDNNTGEKILDERPVVELNVKFNNKNYENVKFTLTNRKYNSSDVLIGVRFMKELDLIVNPKKEFVLGENYMLQDFKNYITDIPSPEVTGIYEEKEFIHFRQLEPKGFARFRNNDMGKGIHFTYGIKSNGDTEVQSILFDKSKWTESEAKAWLKDHDKKYGDVDK